MKDRSGTSSRVTQSGVKMQMASSFGAGARSQSPWSWANAGATPRPCGVTILSHYERLTGSTTNSCSFARSPTSPRFHR